MVRKFNELNNAFERKSKAAVLPAANKRLVLLVEESFFLFGFGIRDRLMV